MRRVTASLAAALLASATLAACGGDGAEPDASQEAVLVLDFQPNAVHSGIYSALEAGDYGNEGIELEVREPSATSDGAKLLEAGRAQFAVLDIHDLGLARERGLDVVGIPPLVQRPLASVLAGAGVARPRDLEGEKVGVTGVPSDDAVLDSVIEADGGDPAEVDRVTIGFNAVSALAAGKVDAATGFWNAEGVALDREGVAVNEFRVDDFGAPRYPELVVAASRDLIESDPELIDAMVAATQAGTGRASKSTENTLETLLGQVRALDPGQTREEILALNEAHAFLPSGGFDRGELADWAAWDVKHGLLKERPAIGEAFLLSPASSPG